MAQFRVTKYNPAFRRADNGAYMRDDWTSVSDIGGTFADGVLTREEYERVEGLYVEAIMRFVALANVDTLRVAALEFYGPDDPTEGLIDIPVAPDDRLRSIIVANLRETIWMMLEGRDNTFIHFGGDFYVFVGSDAVDTFPAPTGLFVEAFDSPFHPEHDPEDTTE